MHKLYKVDTKGKVRVWWIETDETVAGYRVHSGLEDGKKAVSGWKYAKGKNIGKANETTPVEQMRAEVESLYTKQKAQGGYSETKDAMGATYFEPMLAHKFEGWSGPVYSQPKLDGIRCIAKADGLWTRQGKPIVAVPHINESLRRFFDMHPYAVLDGELYNHDLRSEFEKIVSLVRKTKPSAADIEESKIVQYHVYDAYGAGDIMERLELFKSWIPTNTVLKLVEMKKADTKEELDEAYAEYLADGFEGQMVRALDAKYEQKRSKGLLKRKEFEDAEFRIVDVIEGVGNWAGYAKAITIRLPDGRTQESGMRGTQEFAKEILKDRENLLDTEVTVRYQGTTNDGKLRFPVVTMFWKGKRNV